MSQFIKEFPSLLSGAWLTWELLLLQSPAMAPEKLLDGM
jgi:hypothetical protein